MLSLVRRHVHLAAWLFLILLSPTACGGGGGATGSAGGGGGGPVVPDIGEPVHIPTTPGLVPEFVTCNDAPLPRTETVLASVPMAFGQRRDLANATVDGEPTAWSVLQRWPDGSIRVAQAQFVAALAPGQSRSWRVVDGTARNEPFAPHRATIAPDTGLLLGAEVVDTFAIPYRGFATGAGETLSATALVRTRRWRCHHLAATPGTGIGRDYLTSTFYLTEFAAQPVVIVDWVLGNDYLGADAPGNSRDPDLRPLGAIDVRAARFLARGPSTVLPYRAATSGIEPAVVLGDGTISHRVLADSWLDDGQTRRWRFVLLAEDGAASASERQVQADTAAAMIAEPLRPLATRTTWQQSHALGLLGGPCDPPADAWQRAEQGLRSWAAANHFGAFGGHGDVLKTATTGTPRNGPCSQELGRAISAGHPGLLTVLEQKAWAQALRPYHLYGLRVADDQDILLWDGIPLYPGSRDLSRESLGRRALWAADPYAAYRTQVQYGSQRAHGFDHFDIEHWTTDLLFDHWTITGDCWAREELRQLGESLKGVLRPRGAVTSAIQSTRAEGWCMQGLVQCFLATGDESLRVHARHRLHVIVEPFRQRTHDSRALGFQGSYPGTRFPTPHQFYMPWQHAALLYGYLAAARMFQDAAFVRVCDDVVTAIEYAWVTNYRDPVLGVVPNGLRYYCPISFQGRPILPAHWDSVAGIGVRWGDSPLGGANTFFIGSLYLLVDQTTDATVSARARRVADLLRQVPYTDDMRWDRWRFCAPEPFTR